MTATLVVLLSFFIVAGRFLDYVIGADGDATAKEALSRFAGTREYGNASTHEFIDITARLVQGFLTHRFGRAILSTDLAVDCFVFSACITSILFFVIGLSDPSIWSPTGQHSAFALISLQICSLVIVVFVVDLFSLVVTRLFLGQIVDADPGKAVLFILLQSALTYFCLIMAMNLTFSGILFARGLLGGYFFDAEFPIDMLVQMAESWWLVFHTYTLEMFFSPLEEGQLLGFGETNLIVFAFTACLPSIAILFTFLTAIVVDLIDTATGGGVHVLLRRLAKDEKPLFLRLSLVGSALIAFIEVI